VASTQHVSAPTQEAIIRLIKLISKIIT